MRNLLVAVDFSQHTPRVMEVAEKLAREFNCPMRLVHVDDVKETDFQEMVEIKDNEAKIEALASRMRSAGLEASSIAKRGPIVESLLEEIHLHDIEHIVAGTHGHSAAKEFFLGSVTKELLRNCALPLTLVPRQERDWMRVRPAVGEAVCS